ncbi:MAG: hypothetical protein AB4080_22740 [Trichodesmium sp.]
MRVGDRRQETGVRSQESGDRRQETGDRRQEAGGRRHGNERGGICIPVFQIVGIYQIKDCTSFTCNLL